MESAPPPPGGTVTFLFTDIEGSTKLWEQHPEPMRLALARHDAVLRHAIETNGGYVFKTMGDQFCAAFPTALKAFAAALAAQQAVLGEEWKAVGPLRVRMALHTGAAEERGGDYFGAPLNRVARLLDAGHGGQILLSQATAEPVRDGLPEAASLRDLGSHRLKDLQQPEHLFQLLHPSLPAVSAPLRSLEAFAHNLPVQLTSFVGRQKEMAAVKQLLGSTHLLTLTGAGGCGKTRLVLQVAADLAEQYADGVWLIELAALADPALVPQTVASALGVREEPGRPLAQTLSDSLRPKSLLLVLDNCEHLLSACAQLAESLLRGCPNLRILATSREALGIPGEQTYRVPSLSLPDPRQLPPLERLQEFEAVQLFADRARLSQSTFAVTQANALAVAQVCERLDGIPLAIELGAARVRALPVEKIHERLDDRFRLLTGGSRTALPRQQTLRATMDWSYELLAEAERTLLRRLSVFAGGFTLEAAEAVCADGGDVLDLLGQLVDKSLVLAVEQAGEARYRLLETIREYGDEKLQGLAEAAVLHERHRDWFLGLAEEAEPRLLGPEQKEWLTRLEREHDNLRAALAWSGTHGQGEAGLRLGGALWPFWEVRGYLGEGRERLAALLALPGAEARTTARAKALHGAGILARAQDSGAARALLAESLAIYRELDNNQGIAYSLNGLGWTARAQGDFGAARALLKESLAIFRELGDKRGIAYTLRCLGHVARDQGDYKPAQALLEESVAVFRKLGNKQGIALSLNGLGAAVCDLGDFGAARALLEESLAIQRELGDKPEIAWSLNWLGHVARGQGDYGAARALLEESLAIFRELGHKRGIPYSLNRLGRTACAQWEHGTARALLEESLAIFRELDNKQGIAWDLEGLAAVAVAQAQCERAARLFGAAEGQREAIGAALPPAERAEHDHSVAAVRTALGEEAFAAAWAEGRAMSLEEATRYALED